PRPGPKNLLNSAPARFSLESPRGKRMSGGMIALFAAVANPSALDRIRQVPTEFSLRIATAIVVVVVGVVLLRKIAHVNKIVLSIVVALVVSIVGFNWIYERNEPRWA